MQPLIHYRNRLPGRGLTRRAITLVILGVCLFTLTLTSGQAQVFVRVAPPAPIVEPLPPPPRGERYVWVPGHWHWNGHRYVWRSGHYAVRPRRYTAWVPAHYDQRPGGWYYVPGHWR